MISYKKCGDQLYPDLRVSEERIREVNIWGIRHGEYLKQHKKVIYYNMLTSGSLNGYLVETGKQAANMKAKLIDDMKHAENITEELKAKDMMAWVQAWQEHTSSSVDALNRAVCL